MQGPALLAWNDAQFSEADWEGIRSMHESVKREDPLKVGRFGLGFKSVYHMTGFRMIPFRMHHQLLYYIMF